MIRLAHAKDMLTTPYVFGEADAAAMAEAGADIIVCHLGLNTGGATGLCLDVHDLVLSKYAAGREQDREFNQAIIRAGLVTRRKLTTLLRSMPVDDEMKSTIAARVKSAFAAVSAPRAPKSPE